MWSRLVCEMLGGKWGRCFIFRPMHGGMGGAGWGLSKSVVYWRDTRTASATSSQSTRTGKSWLQKLDIFQNGYPKVIAYNNSSRSSILCPSVAPRPSLAGGNPAGEVQLGTILVVLRRLIQRESLQKYVHHNDQRKRKSGSVSVDSTEKRGSCCR